MIRRTDVSLRVIADHVRTAVMLVGDGVIPSNEGRGYVLRRILRRSIRNLRLLAGGQRGGARGEDRFMHEISAAAIEAMGEQYPELARDALHVQTVIDAEEESFLGTLRTGTAIFEAAVEESKRRGSASARGRAGVPVARHVRVPDRPHPRDGRGTGPDRGRGRVPQAHGRAAPAGQG